MHFYKFNIGDYKRDTEHLEPMEDLAYRRLLDLYYADEKPLPNDMDWIAKRIRMRSHSDCIANVLKEFFTLEDDGSWYNQRADVEISEFNAKSEKAKKSAKARWSNARKGKASKRNSERNANALKTQCEGNAKQETRNKKQETQNKKQIVSAKPKTLAEQYDLTDWPTELEINEIESYLEFRKKHSKKPSMSQTVISNIGKQLNICVANGLNANQCLADAMTSSWVGFKAEWLLKDKKNAQQIGTTEHLMNGFNEIDNANWS